MQPTSFEPATKILKESHAHAEKCARQLFFDLEKEAHRRISTLRQNIDDAVKRGETRYIYKHFHPFVTRELVRQGYEIYSLHKYEDDYEISWMPDDHDDGKKWCCVCNKYESEMHDVKITTCALCEWTVCEGDTNNKILCTKCVEYIGGKNRLSAKSILVLQYLHQLCRGHVVTPQVSLSE